jgi:NAD(P)H dehydrogenase (quinone)
MIGKEHVMVGSRVLVTGAAGKIGGAVATQLLEKGIPTRAMVRRQDARSEHLKAMGAEIVVGDMLDIRQVQTALEGVDRLYFNPPYHPHVLYSAVAFAVAARRAGVEAVVALSQWLASPDHPSLMTRSHWLTDKLFEMMPNAAHVAVAPGFFADNYMNLVPTAAQMGVLPFPTGAGLNAPPSNEDIARVAVGALMDPHRHDAKTYRPTGPTLLSGQDIADAVGEALGRKVRHIDVPPKMFVKAVRATASELGFDEFLQSCLYHYHPEYPLGTWAVGGPTTHVRDVAGVEPEDILTIARRYTTGPECRRTVGNFLRAFTESLRIPLTPMPNIEKLERVQQHPRPAHPQFAGESDFWQAEHEFAGKEPVQL